MPEVSLQRPRVVSSVGKRIAAGAPEHVGVRLKRDVTASNYVGNDRSPMVTLRRSLSSIFALTI
jgi:hypothetical protein